METRALNRAKTCGGWTVGRRENESNGKYVPVICTFISYNNNELQRGNWPNIRLLLYRTKWPKTTKTNINGFLLFFGVFSEASKIENVTVFCSTNANNKHVHRMNYGPWHWIRYGWWILIRILPSYKCI